MATGKFNVENEIQMAPIAMNVPRIPIDSGEYRRVIMGDNAIDTMLAAKVPDDNSAILRAKEPCNRLGKIFVLTK
jgi:hypothetical protein